MFRVRRGGDDFGGAIDARCARHPFALATDVCGECGVGFCADCLVYPFGDRRPAMCLTCALAVGGVRRTHSHHHGRLRPRDLELRRRLLAEATEGADPDPLRIELAPTTSFDEAEAASHLPSVSGTPSIDWAT